MAINSQGHLDDQIVACRHCPRLRHYLKKLTVSYPSYWNKPVVAAGPADAPLLIVGLAPGKHGANKTGIPFTGDASGQLLFKVLDSLNLTGKVRITNAVKCVPPDNKPTGRELNNCQKFLIPEISQHMEQSGPRVLIALGQIAHRAVIKSYHLPQKQFAFAHGAVHRLPDLSSSMNSNKEGRWLVNSYHCSRYNTQTGRLTEGMFRSAIKSAADLAGYTF